MKSKSNIQMSDDSFMGFPTHIEITDDDSLREAETLIIRLDASDALIGRSKDELLEVYKTTRMCYLDNRFNDETSLLDASSLYECYASDVNEKLRFFQQSILTKNKCNSRFYIDSYKADILNGQADILDVIFDEGDFNFDMKGLIDIRKNNQGLCSGFVKIKEAHLASWQDMLLIGGYGLSIIMKS